MPSDSELSSIVKDYDELVALGKALFWDEQAGVDGQACASCHFHAGADSRFKNQISPHGASGTSGFAPTRSGGDGGPNYLLTSEDWPLFEPYDKSDRNSGVRFDTDDTISSVGVFKAVQDNFNGDVTGEDAECSQVYDEFFNIDGVNTRRVEPRNAPTVINSGFAFRLFWDGRANNRFNGVDPFGKRNENARVFRNHSGQYVPEKISLKNAALASLSVGPPLSLFEMNCDGRAFSHIGRKLLNMQPLNGQEVHPDDSVLGQYASSEGVGLNISYGELIEKAIKNQWWNGSADIGGFSHKETNFSLYWGLALQAYQASLVSDDAPLDRYLDGESNHGMSTAAIRGMGVFLGDGKCIACHKGPDLTAAGHVLQSENEEGGLVERMPMGHLPGSSDSSNTYDALYDNGFYNIGVSPTNEDIGLGALDPWGNPLSFTRQEKARSANYFDEPPENSWWCANHGSVCHLPAGTTATVWYGSYEAGKWNVLFNQSESKVCKNGPYNGWGDPAPGYTKHCRLVVNELSDHVPPADSLKCAHQNGACQIPAGQKATVWYGKHSSWTAKHDLTGVVPCDDRFFGDPIYGVAKECKVLTTSIDSLDRPTADSTHCSNQWGYCYTGSLIPDTVWYGKDDTWFVKTNVSNHIYCSNTSFGADYIAGATCRNIQPPYFAGAMETVRPPSHALHCAHENETCELPSNHGATIWYGVNDDWTMRGNQHGDFTCNNDTFGDPVWGIFKSCKYVLHGPDPFFTDPDTFEVDAGKAVKPHERDAVDGSFKTSGLRNVELTGPYFHNGGQLTLRQVVEFYNRGGDRQRTHVNGQTCDTTGFDDNCTNIDPDIESLSLSDSQMDDLVEFLKALTDDRVREEKAPFDHPSITLPLGHTGDENDITPVSTASGGTVAEDALFVLPAVGANGRTADGRRPLPRFDQLVSCTDSNGDIVACFDEAYNTADYEPDPEPEPTGPRVEFDSVVAVPLYPQYPWINYWNVTIRSQTVEIPPGHLIKLYWGGADGNGNCSGPLVANVWTNNPMVNTFATTVQYDSVCFANYYTRESMGSSTIVYQ